VPADIVLYALVAAGLIIWLRSVLGTRHGDERQRPNPFVTPAPSENPASPASNAAVAALPDDHHIIEAMPERTAILPLAEAGLQDITRIDRSFSAARFVKSAQDAFVMVVESFAKGNRDTLKMLLSPTVYASFDKSLSDRENSRETMSADIHAIRRTEIISAELQGRIGLITLRFVADETLVTRDAEGNIVSGHPDRVFENIDIWTFSRDLRGRDPAWLLVETREEESPSEQNNDPLNTTA
jgi:predicted lipid-binding transport protein (Tim44 family)